MIKKRVPLIKQISPNDCALTCLSMILSYYKSYISSNELKERLGSGRDGVSLLALLNTANDIGFDAKVYKGEIMNITSPIIVYWENHHYVVLEKVNKKGYFVLDPALGNKVYPEKDFYKKYAGYYMTLEPNSSFQRRKKKSVWKPYFRIPFEKPKLLASILFWSLLIQLFTVAMPVIIQFAIDEIANPNNLDLLTIFFMSIIFLVLFKGIISYLRGRFLANLRIHLDWRLTKRFINHLVNLPFQYFQLRSFGDIVYRANSHVMLRELFSQQTIMTILDSTLIIIIILYMANHSLWLTGWVIAFGLLNILLLTTTQKKLQEYSEEEVSEQSNYQGFLVENINGIFGIKMAGVENIVLNQWEVLFSNVLKAFKKKEYFTNTIYALIISLETAAPLIILGLALHQVLLGNLTIGLLVAFFSLTGTFYGLIASLVSTAQSIITMNAYLYRMNDVLDAPVESTPETAIVPEKLYGNIELKNVYFSYTKYSAPVLKNINITIKQGQKVAIVGPSGSGKSTLARTLLGLYEPSSGEIYYDGINLLDLDKKWLRRNVGVVPQDASLFNKSILHNISVYDENPSMDEVYKAAKFAMIHDEIMEMPLGYHTNVSEMSMNISGGQKQRIMLARALLQKPSILMLDEATSSLDNLNEKGIEEHLKNMGCTRIVIAHRLSTIIDADQILVLSNGEIKESGTHDELINKKGYYYDLYYSNFDYNSVLT
ncbi:peptidase domain-containing ABC transporter [Caldifermentibacillus hisashii]|uniref:peptidase domain-containing ABC transporter n=1 Tax=Caldifermentibacillus hisashii TaxID=996558 RepID=UPI0031360EDF